MLSIFLEMLYHVSAVKSRLLAFQSLRLNQCEGCDIMTEFLGSDHAPVWLDFEMKSISQPALKLPRLESSLRFKPQKGIFLNQGQVKIMPKRTGDSETLVLTHRKVLVLCAKLPCSKVFDIVTTKLMTKNQAKPIPRFVSS